MKPTWDAARGQIRLGDKAIDLTTRQKLFMAVVAAKPGRVVTENEVVRGGIGEGKDAYRNSRRHIRKQMMDAFGTDRAMVTVNRAGTRWDGDVTDDAPVGPKFILTPFGEPMKFEPAVRQAVRDGFKVSVKGIAEGVRVIVMVKDDGKLLILSETPGGPAFVLRAGKGQAA